MNTDIDSLINAFDYQTTVQFKPTHIFMKDINVILEELLLYDTFIGLDIYEVLVSCGHNLTWNYDYFITIDDLNWFKNDGKKYFFSCINQRVSINDMNEYRSICDIHFKLSELFELQLA